MARHPMPTFIWRLLNKIFKLSPGEAMLKVPCGILGNFSWHYALYDDDSVIVDATRTFLDAFVRHKRTGLHVTRILD